MLLKVIEYKRQFVWFFNYKNIENKCQLSKSTNVSAYLISNNQIFCIFGTINFDLGF